MDSFYHRQVYFFSQDKKYLALKVIKACQNRKIKGKNLFLRPSEMPYSFDIAFCHVYLFGKIAYCHVCLFGWYLNVVLNNYGISWTGSKTDV